MKLDISADGIKNIYWPVSFNEYEQASKRIKKIFLDSQKFFFKKKLKDFHIFSCLQTYIVQKLLYLYQEKKIKKLVNKYDKKTKNFLFSLDSKGSYEHLLLQRGLKKKNKLFRYLRLIKNYDPRKVFSYKRLEKIKKEDLNVVVSNNTLIQEYLTRQNKNFYLIPLYEWFYEASKEELFFNKKKIFNSDLINYFLKKIETEFIKLNCKLTNEELKDFKKWILENFFWINLYLVRLDKMKNKLPKLLLTGSLGIIWCRILAIAVRKNGGKVINFDHCLGDLSINTSTNLFAESNASDIFYTFNKVHINYHSKFIKESNNSFSKSKINSLLLNKDSIKINKIKKTDRGKKILFISSPFLLNQGLSYTFFPPPILIDWHIRLLKALKRTGYEIIYKPHPDCNKKIVRKIISLVKIKTENKLLESICHKYDYLFFDYRSTNAWSFAIRTDMPIILSDVDFFCLSKKDTLLLKKRVSLLKINLDKKNKPNFDERNLKNVIINSFKLRKDKTFHKLIHS